MLDFDVITPSIVNTSSSSTIFKNIQINRTVIFNQIFIPKNIQLMTEYDYSSIKTIFKNIFVQKFWRKPFGCQGIELKWKNSINFRIRMEISRIFSLILGNHRANSEPPLPSHSLRAQENLCDICSRIIEPSSIFNLLCECWNLT